MEPIFDGGGSSYLYHSGALKHLRFQFFWHTGVVLHRIERINNSGYSRIKISRKEKAKILE